MLRDNSEYKNRIGERVNIARSTKEQPEYVWSIQGDWYERSTGKFIECDRQKGKHYIPEGGPHSKDINLDTRKDTENRAAQLSVTIQHMLGVEDGDVVAQGLSIDGYTVNVFFEKDNCVKQIVGLGDEISREEFEHFDARKILHTDMQYWYISMTSEELVSWCETFGKPLNMMTP